MCRGLELPDAVKRRITRLKNEKLKFYANDARCQFKSDAAVKSEEVSIFRDLLNGRAEELRKEAQKLMRLLAEGPSRQRMLDGSVEDIQRQLTLDRQGREAEIARLMAESEGSRETSGSRSAAVGRFRLGYCVRRNL